MLKKGLTIKTPKGKINFTMQPFAGRLFGIGFRTGENADYQGIVRIDYMDFRNKIPELLVHYHTYDDEKNHKFIWRP